MPSIGRSSRWGRRGRIAELLEAEAAGHYGCHASTGCLSQWAYQDAEAHHTVAVAEGPGCTHTVVVEVLVGHIVHSCCTVVVGSAKVGIHILVVEEAGHSFAGAAGILAEGDRHTAAAAAAAAGVRHRSCCDTVVPDSTTWRGEVFSGPWGVRLGRCGCTCCTGMYVCMCLDEQAKRVKVERELLGG